MKAKKRVAIKADDWCVRLKDQKFKNHEMNLEIKLFIASAKNGENLIIEGDDVVVEWVLETPFFDEEASGLILDPAISNENHFIATLNKVISCGVFIFVATHKGKEVQLVLDGKTLYIC